MFPLIDWGWDRQQCEAYVLDRFSLHWPKSYCRSALRLLIFSSGLASRSAAAWKRRHGDRI
ncbi:hypothetical protein C3489_29000 [Streptomyces sp. Ru71]|nr:hypothetical protein C3489_29000 [Streptomyces sp. Ru71]